MRSKGSRQQAAGLRGAVLVAMLGMAALLAGCSGKEVPDGWLALTEMEAQPPAIPGECLTGNDPRWVDLPDRDVLQDEGARNVRDNKDRFRRLAGKRRVCAAGLAELRSVPAPPAAPATR
jgi:hypothetical protein